MSITNFCLQWTRNSCGYCEYIHTTPEPIITTLEPTTREPTTWEPTTLKPTTIITTTTGSYHGSGEGAGSGDGPEWIYEPVKVDLQVFYNKSYILRCDYDEMHDYLACNDYCNGRSYWLDGVWGTFFAFIASIIAWAGSCKKIPETFTVLYRVQATFVSIVFK